MQVFQVMWSRIRYYASHACYVCMCNKIIATGMLVTVAKAVQTTTVMTEPVSVSYNIFVLLLTRRVQDWIKVQSTLTMYWLPIGMVGVGYIISEEPEYHIISGKAKVVRPPFSASSWFEKLPEEILKGVISNILWPGIPPVKCFARHSLTWPDRFFLASNGCPVRCSHVTIQTSVVLVNYNAPINAMPHYPSPALCCCQFFMLCKAKNISE